jgi:hypothetical protein
MNTVTINVPGDVPAPRGAAWAAQAATALLRAIAKWTAPRAQANAPMVEATQVRALARSYMDSDPGFAADLFAAADRHESASGVR